MKLRKRSIIRHTVVTGSVMLFIFCALMGFLVYSRAKSLLTGQIMSNALDIARTCAAHIDAEVFSGISEGDEDSPEYQSIVDAMSIFRDHSELEYIYTVVYNTGKTPVFCVDSDPEDRAMIGEAFDYSAATISALNGTASADSKAMTDEWGTHLSAYAPITLDDRTIGAVGVDLDYNWVLNEYNKILTMVVTICVLFCLIGVFFLLSSGNTMKKEIRALDKKIDGLRIDAENMMMMKELRQGDEFEYLADHINQVFSENRDVRKKEQMELRVYEEEAYRRDVAMVPDTPVPNAPVQETRSELETAYDASKVLDYAEAKRYLEDEQLIRVTLKEFYQGITDNAEAIERFLADGDYENYTIKVHALKSSARMIGAGALSENARILEELGNRLRHEEAG